MTHEERLDRLERIAKLMVRAGLRARREMRGQDGKINILIDRQKKTEEALASHAEAHARASAETDEKIGILIDSQIQNEERFASLARAQERTEAGLNGLRETVERFINESRGSHH
jgi:sulfite reductase alpha subunit-like flavoprotein